MGELYLIYPFKNDLKAIGIRRALYISHFWKYENIQMVQTNGKYRYLNLDKETIAKENKREREKQQEGMTYFI